MAKTLVTGGTGFIGSHVARLLLRRADELRLTVRGGSTDTELAELLGGDRGDFETVKCDLLDRRAVRRALKGVDRVFHVAGVTSLRPADAERVFEVNVGGTQTVLEECLRGEVERVVYTSSVAAIGPARRGRTADEGQQFSAAELDLDYVNSKHQAEVEAMRIAAQGLPLVCVNPTFVLGPGDVGRGSTGLVRRFLLGRITTYPDGALNVVDVRDVARGHLLADRRGVVGERYILGGRNFTLKRLFADLARLSGAEPPALRLPAPVASRVAGLLAAAPGDPPANLQELKSASQWWTYRSTKAKRELAWSPRPHEETLEATVRWYLDREGDWIEENRRGQPRPLKAAAGLLGAAERVAGAVFGKGS